MHILRITSIGALITPNLIKTRKIIQKGALIAPATRGKKVKKIIHPFVYVLRKEIRDKKHAYIDISAGTGISPTRLKNILTGRVEPQLSESDALCQWLGLSPVEAVMRRVDLNDREDYLNLTMLTPARRELLKNLYQELAIQ